MESIPTHPSGRTLKLYLVDGSPNGVITAELGISSVLAVTAPRSQFVSLFQRPEVSQTGIYVLAGPTDDVPDRDTIYVGEADTIRERLRTHDADQKKDFFTKVVVIITKDENLTKAHARYLESRLIQKIIEADRADTINIARPSPKGLPESEKADMERVLGEIEVLLPVLGFDVLRAARTSVRENIEDDDRTISYELTDYGLKAVAVEVDGDFIIIAGAEASKEEKSSIIDSNRKRRARALQERDLIDARHNAELWVTTKDLAFKSPSAAANFLYGGNMSGPLFWKSTLTGDTYRDTRQALLAKNGVS